jgi:hypothetical protein
VTGVIVWWIVTSLWAGVAVVIFFDAKRHSRAALVKALGVFFLPGLGLAVYLGTRGASGRQDDTALTPNGERLLREMTAEVMRLRARLVEVGEDPGPPPSADR